MLIQFREMAHSIHGFMHVPVSRRRQIGSVAAIPDEFLQAASVACDAHPRLAVASQVTGQEFRDTMEFAREFLSVADELELLSRGLRGTVALRRFESVQLALRTTPPNASIVSNIGRRSSRIWTR